MPREAEIWHPVVGWETWYEVSTMGRVRTVARTVPTTTPQGLFASRLLPSIVLTTQRNRRGHRRVMLSAPGRHRKHAYVHALVAAAFFGPRPPGHLVCHRDDRKTNNQASNLYYGTPTQNAQDALRNGCHGTERPRRRRA